MPSATAVDPTDPAELRALLSLFATGVVALSAAQSCAGRPVGLIVNSFTSVSLRPALVSVCVAETSTTWPVLRRAHRFYVNFLSLDQLAVCRRMAGRGADRFSDVPLIHAPGDGPVLDGALAWLECSLEAEHPAGDHVIAVARAHSFRRARPDAAPLVFHQSRYGTFAHTEEV